ncbi:MAG: M1 family aminopeptidase [Flavobacteriales bacterium]
MNKYIYLSLAFASLSLLHAQEKSVTKTFLYDEKSVPREHLVDFEHLRLEVSFNPQLGEINGKVTHIFTPKQNLIDSIFVDGPGIRIKSVTQRNKPLRFKSYAETHSIFFDQPLKWEARDSITIEYAARPTKGLYFIGWNDKTNRARKQIWSQGQGIDNRYWIPMYDEMNDKIVSEMIVKMTKPYKVLSNGVLLNSKDNQDGTITWHYRMSKPHAPYLIMLGIGEYSTREVFSKSGVKSTLYYYPDHENRFEPTYRYSAEMIDFFEQEIGVPYPWETYAQIPVSDFLYGAMENTTATVFGDFFCVDARGYLDRNYVAVNAHELAHQWFGDLVTARSSTHHWLQESFATHYNWLFERVAFGDEHFDMARRNANNSALQASQRDNYPVGHSKGGSTRHYPKGAYVLEMLKYVTGREAYNRAVKNYLERHAYRNVNTQDLLVAFHETLGLSLDWFWEQWILRGGEPEYKVQTTFEKDILRFSVTQVHDTSDLIKLFKMPIDFEVHYTDGTVDRKKEWIEKHNTIVEIPLAKGKKVAFFLFDPNSQLLKKVSFDKSFDVLVAQAGAAPFMLDRLDAVEALNSFPLKDKLKALHELYKKEKSHYVKAAILKQLSSDGGKQTRTAFAEAIQSSQVQMRKAALNAFDKIPLDLKTDFERLLSDSSYAVIDQALTKLSISFPDDTDRYLELTKNEKGINGLDLRMTWLEIAAYRGNAQALKELTDYCSMSFDFNVRRNAMSTLRRLKVFNQEIFDHALDAAMSYNGRLASGAIGFINHFFKQPEYTSMINVRYTKGQWNEREESIWKRIRD